MRPIDLSTGSHLCRALAINKSISAHAACIQSRPIIWIQYVSSVRIRRPVETRTVPWSSPRGKVRIKWGTVANATKKFLITKFESVFKIASIDQERTRWRKNIFFNRFNRNNIAFCDISIWKLFSDTEVRFCNRNFVIRL